MQFGVNLVGAGILTVHLRRPDSRNNLPFARSRAVHAERLDLVISDTVSAVELKPAIVFVEAGRIKTKGRALQAVTKEVVGTPVLLTRPVFACDILRRLLRRVSLAKSTSAPLRF
jgi:hypothetical protein